MISSKYAILLINLGSPDSTSNSDVRKYLKEFLMDERVIDTPYLVRTLLVKGIIAPFRAPKSAIAYKRIWTEKGSPLIELTKQLQKAIQQKMPEIPVEIAMRYGHPATSKVLEKLHREHPDLEEIILFPLYPHYAMSSYETAVVQVQEIHKKLNYTSRLVTFGPYYQQPLYIKSLTESIAPYLQQDFDKLIFSYHGVPERHIRKGDTTGCHCLKVNDCCHVASAAHKQCYRHQTFRTTELVTESLNLPKEKVEQTFQSRLGRDPWLSPYTAARLAELPKEGVKKLLIVCPAFVSDCLETLDEIATEGKHIFMEAGGAEFTMIPCLNTQPIWVDSIVTWINDYQSGNTEMILS